MKLQAPGTVASQSNFFTCKEYDTEKTKQNKKQRCKQNKTNKTKEFKLSHPPWVLRWEYDAPIGQHSLSREQWPAFERGVGETYRGNAMTLTQERPNLFNGSSRLTIPATQRLHSQAGGSLPLPRDMLQKE